MACPSVATGSQFLVQTLAHLDCQAQTLGSFGFQSLAAPGSPAALLLTALLTLFVALFGIRMLFGPAHSASDLVTAVLKVGIVLTLAVSWPAWRIVAYDTVLYGPAEVASSVMPSTLPDPRGQFAERLQSVDTGIAAFTQAGTGRQTGAILDEGTTSGFRQIALEDEAGLGWARPVYLATTIGSLAVVRVAGGLLLALAPLFAGLLLFDLTRGMFVGWLRGLALVALGSLGLTVLLSVELAILEPWLADVLNRRGLGYATPTAPTELLALVAAFAIAAAGLMFILGKVAFQNAWVSYRPAIARIIERAPAWEQGSRPLQVANEIPVHSRALAISESVASSIRRDEVRAGTFDPVRRIGMDRPSEGGQGISGTTGAVTEPLGSGYRRNHRRDMQSQRRRDDRG